MKSKIVNINVSKSLRSLGLYIIFIVMAVVNLFPILWSMLTSFKPIRDVLAYPPKIFNFMPSIEHYKEVFKNGFAHSVFISIGYSASSILIGLVLGLLFAYSIKRFNYPGRMIMFYMVLCGIPLSLGSAAMVIPNYIYFTNIGMIDKWYTLVLIYTAYNLPMAIWIIMGGIESVPIEVEESMRIDGVSRGYLIFGMVPRLCLPAMAAAALFIFIGAWNEYIASSVMVNSTNLKPIQVSIYDYLGFYGRQWGPLTASATAAVVPTLIVFTFLGKLLISGLTQGAVKE
jgi:ABC-type glycerol-3-phosphate transport system permease component